MLIMLVVLWAVTAVPVVGLQQSSSRDSLAAISLLGSLPWLSLLMGNLPWCRAAFSVLHPLVLLLTIIRLLVHG